MYLYKELIITSLYPAFALAGTVSFCMKIEKTKMLNECKIYALLKSARIKKNLLVRIVKKKRFMIFRPFSECCNWLNFSRVQKKKGVLKKSTCILSFKKYKIEKKVKVVYAFFASLFKMEAADQAMHSLFAGTATELHLLTGFDIKSI